MTALGKVELRSLEDRVEIAPGVFMPRLGLGTYKAGPGREVESEVAYALGIGYRGVDTASMYGNETGVGDALASSGVARDEVFVATKVWNDEQGYDGTMAACERSLTRLGLDRVDLYLIHWPVPGLMRETWRAMERLLELGSTRAIGVCNFLEEHLEELALSANTPPAVDQVEHHPRLQQPALRDYLRGQGITMQAWAPIMRGEVARVPTIVEIGGRHGKSAAQVSIRWILQHGVTTIPKSVHDERIAENADVFDFELSDDEMGAIDALDTGDRVGRHPDSFGWTLS